MLRERPDLALAYGVRGAEARLAPLTEASLGAHAATLAALAERLAAIDRAALAPADAARLDSLLARVARERDPLAAGTWRREPSAYLALGPGAVLDAATAAHASPCTRARWATKRLRALPEVLRAARVNLAASPANAADEAPWRAAMDSLRALPARLAPCREAVREADLVEADSLALDAVRRFLVFLREERPAAR